MKNMTFAFVIFFSEVATGLCDPQIEVVNKGFRYETYIEQIVKIGELTLNSPANKRIPNHPWNAKEQIRFLNKDFKTKLFNRYNIVKVAEFIVGEPDTNGFYITIGPDDIHLGIIEVGFNRCTDLNSAYNTVQKSNRLYFITEVFNVFTVLRIDHSIIFIYSETPVAPPVLQLNQEIEIFAKEKKKCQP